MNEIKQISRLESKTRGKSKLITQATQIKKKYEVVLTLSLKKFSRKSKEQKARQNKAKNVLFESLELILWYVWQYVIIIKNCLN